MNKSITQATQNDKQISKSIKRFFTRCYCSLVPRSSNGFCRCFAFQIGKICYHHCIIRHFQFRKCLPVNSNFFSMVFTLSFGVGNVEYWQKLYFCFGKIEEKETVFSFLFPIKFISPNLLMLTCVLSLSLVNSYSEGNIANRKLFLFCLNHISICRPPLRCVKCYFL